MFLGGWWGAGTQKEHHYLLSTGKEVSSYIIRKSLTILKKFNYVQLMIMITLIWKQSYRFLGGISQGAEPAFAT